MKSIDNGLNWQTPVLLSTKDSIASQQPNIAYSNNTICCTWTEADDIYCNYSHDNGNTWLSAPMRLCNIPANSIQPSVVGENDIFHLVWMDHNNHSRSVDYDVLYRGTVLYNLTTTRLVDGWNLLGFSADVDNRSWTAYDWAMDIEWPELYVLEIIKLSNNHWESYIHRDGGNPEAGIVNICDFELDNESAYFVHLNMTGTHRDYQYTFDHGYAGFIPHELIHGWNAISIPYSDYDNASDVLASDINLTALYHWNNDWEGYWRDGAGTDFDVQWNHALAPFDDHTNAQGLFLYSEEEFTWN